MKQLACILILLISLKGVAQKNEFKENNAFGTLGTTGTGIIAGAQYERLILKKGLFIRVGAHYVSMQDLWGGTGTTSIAVATLGATYLMGSSSKSFELGAGANLSKILKGELNNGRNPTPFNFAIGGRWQRKSGILFRIGLGYPEGIYFSLGYSF